VPAQQPPWFFEKLEDTFFLSVILFNIYFFLEICDFKFWKKIDIKFMLATERQDLHEMHVRPFGGTPYTLHPLLNTKLMSVHPTQNQRPAHLPVKEHEGALMAFRQGHPVSHGPLLNQDTWIAALRMGKSLR
jgi:hypothetical protein